MAYPMKKIPAPNPKAVALRPRSSLIVSFAKPTLFRSRNAMKYRKTISGNTRRLTLLIVRSPNSPSDSTDVRDPGITVSNHEGITTGQEIGRRGGVDDAAAGLRIFPAGVSDNSWAAYVFAVPPPVQGTAPAQGRLVFQLPIRQLLAVRHVKGAYAPTKAARSNEIAEHSALRTCLRLSDEFLYRKRQVADEDQRGKSAANPLSTDLAFNCVESQRTRRLIEARLRRGQVFPGCEGHRQGEVIRGGFMASGRARCRRR